MRETVEQATVGQDNRKGAKTTGKRFIQIKKAGDGDRTHDNHVGNVVLYH